MTRPGLLVDIPPERLVDYTGILHQALRYLSAWVERGVAPPETTVYQVVEGQVIAAPTAATRHGVQPVVHALANGGTRAEVTVDQPVVLTGTIDVPPGAGKVVKAEWDFEGLGTYPAVVPFQTSADGSRATVSITHAFAKPVTWFAVLRGISHPQRHATTSSYALAQNLARVRVVVRP